MILVNYRRVADMIILETERLILRDFTEADIPKRIEWETIDREWQKWDGPWEYEGLTAEQEQANLAEYIAGLHEFARKISMKKDDDMRYSFQLELKGSGEYIGWISCYCIDDDYVYTDADGKYTFGIDIPSQACRGKGYGYEAFHAVLEYLTAHGMTEVYTQTWSGNVRMTALAEKLGFTEICRKKDYRTVAGKKYDGLTFVYKG